VKIKASLYYITRWES